MAPPAKQPKQRRSWSIHLADASGAKLLITIERRRDGSWKTYGQHVTGTGKTRKVVRGASALHIEEKSARAAQEKLVAAAKAAGWTPRLSRRAHPDAFDADHLPKAQAKQEKPKADKK